MTRPADYPDWATGASADVVEPTAGKKLVGWVAGERPPAQYMNWLAERVRDYLQWLVDRPRQVLAQEFLLEPGGNAPVWGDDHWASAAAGGSQTLRVPVRGRVGESIANLILRVRSSATVGEVITAALYDIDTSDDTSAQIGASLQTALVSAYGTLDWTGDGDFPFTIVEGHYYHVAVAMAQTANPGLLRVYGMDIVPV